MCLFAGFAVCMRRRSWGVECVKRRSHSQRAGAQASYHCTGQAAVLCPDAPLPERLLPSDIPPTWLVCGRSVEQSQFSIVQFSEMLPNGMLKKPRNCDPLWISVVDFAVDIHTSGMFWQRIIRRLWSDYWWPCTSLLVRTVETNSAFVVTCTNLKVVAEVVVTNLCSVYCLFCNVVHTNVSFCYPWVCLK